MDSQSRQEYVKAAVSFLQNPKLVDSTLQDKLKFLKDKGLSQVEVDEALNLALINRHQAPSGKWNFILILGLCVTGYKLYQAYLESKSRTVEALSENQKKPRSTIEPKAESHETSCESDGEDVSMKDLMKKTKELKNLMELQRTNMQSELQSIKTLLLGHEKFAAPPVIPAWQLEEAKSDDKTKFNDTEKSDDETKPNDEAKSDDKTKLNDTEKLDDKAKSDEEKPKQ